MNISSVSYQSPARLFFSKNIEPPKNKYPDKPAQYTDEDWAAYLKSQGETSKNSRANMECRRHRSQRPFTIRETGGGFFQEEGYLGIDE